MEYFGYNPPFFGGHQGVLSKQSGDRLIKNDVLQLLLTSVGERVMRPNYGTILRSSLFEPMTDSLITEITRNIASTISTHENRISATVDVTRLDDDNLLRVRVAGFYTDQANRSFEVELNLPFSQPSI